MRKRLFFFNWKRIIAEFLLFEVNRGVLDDKFSFCIFNFIFVFFICCLFLFRFCFFVVLIDFTIGLIKLIVTVGVNPLMRILLWISLPTLHIDIIAGLPNEFVNHH